MPPVPDASSLLRSQGVHVIGDFAHHCGLSQSARDILSGVRSLGLPVEELDLPLFGDSEPARRIPGPDPGSLPPPASRISICNLNADSMASLAGMLPRSFFEDRYLIGVWYWETEVFPPHHQTGFDFVDEVWVASRHIRETLEKVSPVPIRQFVPLIHPPRPAGRNTLPAALDNDRFLFLFCYDFRSMAERKNPAGTCEAFVRAFPEPPADGPLLVLKSIAAQPENLMEFLDLRRRFRHRPDIIFMDGWLPVDERDALMNRADCYVSLHRAEGLGLTLLESMSLGKPCIGTAYSGNLDFMTPENSWLIPCRMIPVGPHRWPFPKDQVWADPDLHAASAAMREAVSRPALLQEKAVRARNTVTTQHSPAAAAAALQSLLEAAITRPARPKPGMSSPSSGSGPGGRAQAIGLMKQIKPAQREAGRKTRALHGWRIPSGLRGALESIVEVQKLQSDTLSQILRELGDMKQHVRGYDRNAFERLLQNQQRSGRLILDLVEDLWTAAPPDHPAPPASS